MISCICRFADNPDYYDGCNFQYKNSSDPNVHVRSMTHNLQAADFGLGSKEMDNPEKVNLENFW